MQNSILASLSVVVGIVESHGHTGEAKNNDEQQNSSCRVVVAVAVNKPKNADDEEEISLFRARRLRIDGRSLVRSLARFLM